MPVEAVKVNVFPETNAVVGVTVNTMPVGVDPTATPPTGVADVHPIFVVVAAVAAPPAKAVYVPESAAAAEKQKILPALGATSASMVI
jgi:hypothetical protein